MRCPYCGSLETQVKDSRPTEDASSIRRRRVCPDCGGRFTTFERVQLRELTVVKNAREDLAHLSAWAGALLGTPVRRNRSRSA